MGTQRIENAVTKVLPNAKVVRVDADTMSRKHLFRCHRQILLKRKATLKILSGFTCMKLEEFRFLQVVKKLILPNNPHKDTVQKAAS